jgi:hypothetical protein
MPNKLTKIDSIEEIVSIILLVVLIFMDTPVRSQQTEQNQPGTQVQGQSSPLATSELTNETVQARQDTIRAPGNPYVDCDNSSKLIKRMIDGLPAQQAAINREEAILHGSLEPNKNAQELLEETLDGLIDLAKDIMLDWGPIDTSMQKQGISVVERTKLKTRYESIRASADAVEKNLANIKKPLQAGYRYESEIQTDAYTLKDLAYRMSAFVRDSGLGDEGGKALTQQLATQLAARGVIAEAAAPYVALTFLAAKLLLDAGAAGADWYIAQSERQSAETSLDTMRFAYAQMQARIADLNGLVGENCPAASATAASCAWPNAVTIQLQSCGNQEVQNALNKVTADGTTIIIPSGTCSWPTPVDYSQKYSTVIQGSSTTNGTCAPGGDCTPTDRTIITSQLTYNPPSVLLSIATASGKSFRLTGVSFQNSVPDGKAAQITGSSRCVRIDHNHFSAASSGVTELEASGAMYGVIDHNLFDTTTDNVVFLGLQDPGWSGSGDSSDLGNGSWADGPHYGSPKFVFAENNTFNGVASESAYAFDCSTGGRLVFRDSVGGTGVTLLSSGINDNHRGCRAEEIYRNAFASTGDSTAPSSNPMLSLGSGSGLFWGNTISGFQKFIQENSDRPNKGESAPPNGWGNCGIAANGSPSSWDQNMNSNGYSCIDQVGRGTGDLLTGSAFPNIIDSISGGINWPFQAPEPVYAWGNTFNPPSASTENYYWINKDTVSVENRDYYLQLPNYGESKTFDGSAGIGQGSLLNRPSTCTPYAAFWATDKGNGNQSGSGAQGQLFVCTATNTWTPYYSPYTYPHPSDPITSPAATGSLSGSAVQISP